MYKAYVVTTPVLKLSIFYLICLRNFLSRKAQNVQRPLSITTVVWPPKVSIPSTINLL